MLRTLKAWFDDNIAQLGAATPGPDALALATAALLLEIARADHAIEPAELAAIKAAVSRLCTTVGDDIDNLFAAAETAVEASVSFYDFTRVINEELGAAHKFELLVTLWQVACADGRLDHYEEYYIRRLADLLHLSQRDYIRAKHTAGAG